MNEKNRNRDPLRQVLTNRSYWQWSVSAQLQRFPSFMMAYAFMLIGYYVTNSSHVGALMITTSVLCMSIFAIPFGRFIDKVGVVRGIMILCVLCALFFCAMAIVAYYKGPVAYLLVFAGLAGMCSSGVSSGMRRLLDYIIPNSLLRTALALDATIMEGVVVSAPLIVIAVSVLSPVGGILTMAISIMAGAALLINIKLKIQERDSGTTDEFTEKMDSASSIINNDNLKNKMEVINRGMLWRSKKFCFYLLVQIGFGSAIGTIETGVLPWVTLVDKGAGYAGISLTVLSACSIVSGLTYAKFSHRLPNRSSIEVPILLLLVVSGTVGMALSTNWIYGTLGMGLVGLCLPVLGVVVSTSVSSVVSPDRQSEAYGALGSTYVAGYGLGGILFALLPVKFALLSGGLFGIIALCSAPFFLINRSQGPGVIAGLANKENISKLDSN